LQSAIAFEKHSLSLHIVLLKKTKYAAIASAKIARITKPATTSFFMLIQGKSCF
jgi:hypothetical protein